MDLYSIRRSAAIFEDAFDVEKHHLFCSDAKRSFGHYDNLNRDTALRICLTDTYTPRVKLRYTKLCRDTLSVFQIALPICEMSAKSADADRRILTHSSNGGMRIRCKSSTFLPLIPLCKTTVSLSSLGPNLRAHITDKSTVSSRLLIQPTCPPPLIPQLSTGLS